MNVKDLIFGVGDILREQVSIWATSDNGTPHVYPDHPPIDLAKSSYPRATVDVIGYSGKEEDIEKEALVGDVLVDVTVYAVNSKDIAEGVGDSIQAIVDYHDGNNSSGDPYLDNFTLVRLGTPGPIIDEQADPGFTRYNKTQEFEFESITTKSV